MLFLLWVLTSLMFILFRILPGRSGIHHPVSRTVGRSRREAIRESWGLNQLAMEHSTSPTSSIWCKGEFGISFHYQRPVWDVLNEKIVNTLVLMIPATVAAVVDRRRWAGMYFGWRRGSRIERLGVLLPPLIRGIPVFWLGILLLMAFSYGLNWFPNGGMRSHGNVRHQSLGAVSFLGLPVAPDAAVPVHDDHVASGADAHHAQQPAGDAEARTISS